MLVWVLVGPSPFCTVTLGIAPAPLLRRRLLTRSAIDAGWSGCVLISTDIVSSCSLRVICVPNPQRHFCWREDCRGSARLSDIGCRFCRWCVLSLGHHHQH